MQVPDAAYRDPNRGRGRDTLRTLIDTVSQGVPAALREIITPSA